MGIIDRYLSPSIYETGTRRPEAFRANSLQIEAFRAGDFATACKGLLGMTFADTTGLHARYVAWLQRISTDAAVQYIRPARRRLSGLSAVQESKVVEVYRTSRIDAALLLAQQRAIPQNSTILSVDPHPVDRGQVRVRSWVPGEVVSIDVADPLEGDIRLASRVELRVPVRRDPASGMVTYGSRVYTANEAYTVLPKQGNSPEGRVGIYSPDGTHPFGFIPLILVRLQESQRGEMLPPVRLDLLSAQELAVVAYADMERIARIDSFGERVLTGPQAMGAMVALHMARTTSPGTRGHDPAASAALSAGDVKVFEGEGLRYDIVQGKVDLAGYMAIVDRILERAARYVYAAPEGWTGSTGITGVAKQIERQELDEHRWRQESIWQEAEAGLADLIAAVLNAGPHAVSLPQSIGLDVDHLYLTPRQNDLQEAQAMEIAAARGLFSVVERVAEIEGLDEDKAKERVLKRLAEYREIVDAAGITPQGLDRIAKLTEPS